VDPHRADAGRRNPRHKATYLNPTSFIARAAFYFIGWNLIAWRMTALSRAQDEGNVERPAACSG
jgi:hypothetical protein